MLPRVMLLLALALPRLEGTVAVAEQVPKVEVACHFDDKSVAPRG